MKASHRPPDHQPPRITPSPRSAPHSPGRIARPERRHSDEQLSVDPVDCSIVRSGTRRYPVRVWMLLGVLGLAGCDPMAAALQRLAPLARAFVEANSASMLTQRPNRGLDDPTTGRPRVIQPDASG